VRDLFGAVVAMREGPPLAEEDPALDAELPPPLARTALPPGTRLIVFGAPGRASNLKAASSTCPLTAGPATFGACLGCAHCRGPAGLGVACGYVEP